jgi:hypothetical protein
MLAVVIRPSKKLAYLCSSYATGQSTEAVTEIGKDERRSVVKDRRLSVTL